MKINLFNYNLPKNLIAQTPAQPRDSSQLLIYDKNKDKISHDKFFNLKKYLQPGDVLVFNNTKVFPARIKINNKKEIFLLKEIKKGIWECLGKGIKSKEYEIDNLKIEILEKLEGGRFLVKFNLSEKEFEIWLEKYGQTPTPPYIKTKDSKLIRQKYQTVYAQQKGSVAAPTAGLHFTKKMLKQLNKFGVQQEFVTLHVGLGTFAPLKKENVEKNRLHVEFATLDKATCDKLNQAKAEGRRIIAVGTTSVRVLEFANGAISKGKLKPVNDWINLFIYPDYKFKFVDGMITNFHLPKSSLLMLVATLVGRKKILEIYSKAILKKYRFYSFGDAMLII